MSDATKGALALRRFFGGKDAMSKWELADFCGIHVTSISGILSGERRPTIDQAIALKKWARIPVEAWARR